MPTTATLAPSSPACVPVASQESWFTLRNRLTSVNETLPWAPRARGGEPATRRAACWTAVAACVVAAGTTCSGRHELSAVIAASTGAATCCVTSAKSQSGSMCVSECQPQRRPGRGRGTLQPFALISVQDQSWPLEAQSIYLETALGVEGGQVESVMCGLLPHSWEALGGRCHPSSAP